MQTVTVVGTQATANLTTSLAAIGGYTTTAAAIISHINIANTSGAAITVDVTLFNGTTDFYLAKNAPVAVGDALALGGADFKICLATGWGVRARASAGASADATYSISQFV